MAAASHWERRLVLREVLAGCGYTGTEVAERFPIWLPEGGNVAYADYVAFTRSDQQDMSTSAIVAQVVDKPDEIRKRWLPAAAAMAAPAVLFALPDRLTAWATATREQAAEIASAPVDAPGEMVGRLSMLTPEFVTKSKSYGFQSQLFPLDVRLLTESRNQARSSLADIVEQAMVQAATVDALNGGALTPQLVIGALAVLMIRDKTNLPDIARNSTAALIDIAQHKYRGYFDWLSRLNRSKFDTFSRVVDFLDAEVNFAGLEPSMVSHVYEEVLVTQGRRREQGIYYTPPQLAEQMLRVVPVEHIAPQDRKVLDPACGSGTMLLSAAARLSQLQGDQVGSRDRHAYLTSHLHGYDRDSFATEVTKLCLLMTALPIGNSWQVETRDTLDVAIAPHDRPSIMVSNPPWRYNRAAGDGAERANTFLQWMLDNLADEGFLACVIPLSWLNGESSRTSREALLQRAKLLEAWRLPTDIFPSTRSTTSPAVIIAQKTKRGHPSGRVSLVKTVRDASLSAFYATGSADEAYLAEPGRDGSRILRGPVTRAIEALNGFTTIGDVAEVRIGKQARPGRPGRTPGEATHYELGSLRMLHAFAPITQDGLRPVVYPDDFRHANRSDKLVRAHKVLVTAKRFVTRDPWRITVGYDMLGVCPREMFNMVLPKEDSPSWGRLGEDDRFYALMAVLGSGLVACWIDENEPTRNINPKLVARIPFPDRQSSIAPLASIGRTMAQAVKLNKPHNITAAAMELEQVVNTVYQLSPGILEVLSRRLANAKAPEGVIRYPGRAKDERLASASQGEFETSSFGYVQSADEDSLRLWVSGITSLDGTRVSALPQIPGWLCEEGTDFRIDGNLDDFNEARFWFHMQDWLTGDELTRPD